MECPACEAARLQAKGAGHRDWRTGWVCYEHAAFDLDSPAGRALMACVTEAQAEQPDLFTTPDTEAPATLEKEEV